MSSSNSAKKPFKPPSFNNPLKAQSNPSAGRPDTSKTNAVPSKSGVSGKKTHRVAATLTHVVEVKPVFNKDKDSCDFQQTNEPATGKDSKSKGAILKAASKESTRNKTKSKDIASSSTGGPAVLPGVHAVQTTEQKNQHEPETQVFPDSSEMKTTSAQTVHPTLNSSDSQQTDFDSSFASSKNSSGCATPIRELVNSVPWGIHVTPQRGVALQEFKRKLASLSSSPTGSKSTDNTPSFSDQSNTLIENDFASASETSVLNPPNSFLTTHNEAHQSPLTLSPDSDLMSSVRKSNSAPLIKHEEDISESWAHEPLQNFKNCPLGNSQESSADCFLETSQSLLQNRPVAKNDKFKKGNMQRAKSLPPAEPYSSDMFESKHHSDTPSSMTLVPSSISPKPDTVRVNILPSDQIRARIALANETAVFKSDTASKSKSVFKKPPIPNVAKGSKQVDGPAMNLKPCKRSSKKESKNLKTEDVKADVTNQSVKSSGPLPKLPQLTNKTKNPGKPKIPSPKQDNKRSSNQTSLKEKPERSRKSSRKCNDAQKTSKEPKVNAKSDKVRNGSQNNKRKRPARNSRSPDSSNCTTSKNGEKRRKVDSTLPAAQLVVLAASEAGKTGRVPKFVNGKKLSQKERLLALHRLRNVGVWIQCCNSQCSKWRYVDEIKDPIHVPRLWFCKMNPDPNYNSCSKPEDKSQEEEDDLIETKFTAGSLVWGQVSGFPYWPAMVEDDPELEQFYWLDDYDHQKVTYYHVTFFDSRPVSRAWVTAQSIKPFTELESRETKKLRGKHASFSARINEARKMARGALEMDNAQRLAKFSFITRYTGPITKKKIDSPSVQDTFDSSDSGVDSESQNSGVDSESQNSVDPEEVFSNYESKSSSDPNHVTSPSKLISDDQVEGPNEKFKAYPSCDDFQPDFIEENSVISLYSDVIVNDLQNLDCNNKSTSNSEPQNMFDNEVSSSQDIAVDVSFETVNVVSPVMDDVNNLTPDEVRSLSQEVANNENTSGLMSRFQAFFGSQ